MTKQAQKAEVPKDAKAPTHALFHIEERKGDKGFWTEVAVGWANQDGSINLRTNVGAILLPEQVYQLRTRQARSGNGDNSE